MSAPKFVSNQVYAILLHTVPNCPKLAGRCGKTPEKAAQVKINV
jgi:hypothetical protein